MRLNKKSSPKSEKKAPPKAHKKGVVGYNKKTALLEEAITYMNEGKYGRSSAALKELLALDPLNTEARRLFATLHLRLGSLISARTAFESLAREALERQDFWLAESLLREYLTAGPRCVPFLEMLGQVYEQKGDSMAAVAEYGKAIDVLIEDPDADHPDRAADLFAKIRSLAAGSPEAFRLAALFDSATGQLLSPPPASNPISSVEDQQPPTESASTAGESSPTLVEPAPTSPGQATGPETPTEADTPPGPEAPACLVDQPDQNVPTIVHDAASPDSVENEETTVREGSIDEKQVDAAPAQDDVPPPVTPVSDDVPSAPVSAALDASDPPLRLADDEAALPAQAITPTPSPLPTLDTKGFSFEKDAVPQAIEGPTAGPDLSLHEVTQPIAEAPSAPVPMPWDQVQDTTLSIPLPSEEPETAQASDAQPADHPEDASIPEPVPPADDQPTFPVQPESLLSSMSWEEILAAVGKGPDVPPDAKPVMSSTVPHEPIDQALSVSEPSSFDSEHPILTPISEPVAEAQALSVPMPWEQVEEESVPILDHDPEPEFGAVPETPLSPVIDDATAPHGEERTGETNDATLAIGEATPTPSTEPEQAPLAPSPLMLQEPVLDQSTTPLVEPPLDHSALATPAADETQVAPPVPSEPQAIDPSPVQTTADETSFPDETSLPAIVEEAAASVADPLPEAQLDEPLTIRADQETASQEPTFVESEAAAEVAAVPESSGSAATHLDRADQEDPIPVVREPLGIAPAPTDQAALLEEQPVPPSPITESESPAAAPEQAVSGEIKILWDEPSAQSLPEQARMGLLSRWLRRSKPEEPAHVEQSEGPSPEMPPEQLEHTEHLAAEPPTPIIPAGDVAREQAAPPLAALPAGTGEKTVRVKIRSRRAGSLSGHVGSGLVRLIGTCFSTTRSIIVSLLALISAVLASGLAVVGLAVLTWVLMEERPNTAFYNLTATPQRTLQEASANGYLALLGFDRATNQDPAQAGFARRFEKSDLTMTGTCLAGSPAHPGEGRTDTEDRLADWFRDPDPAARFRGQAANLRAWISQHERSMTRYKQWLTMPFEDWGYGEPMSPNCPMILHTHRLYVAEGFAQDADSGIERLVADLTKWRHVMGHAKSLPIKMLAVAAMNDDTAIVSGLLGRPDLDDRLLGPLTKAARPLDQVEQSLRWPMQSELKAAGKIQDAMLKPDAGEPLPLYVQLIAMMPLPAQKRLNLYADYYEASGKASAEGRFAGLPKRAGFVRYPPESWLDYGLNPIENILGVPPLPEWQTYGGRVLELDAKLRLAGLQAWIRRSPKEQDIPTRMAKAGQALYDPFTGFPMLVNARRGLIYSVGQDGKDHDGRPALDIAAVIPSIPGELPQDGKRSASTAKTRP